MDHHLPSCGLESQGNHITNDEDPIVQLWLDSGEGGIELLNGFGDGHIDGCGIKDRGESNEDCITSESLVC